MECILHLRQQFPTTKISVELEKPGRLRLTELAAQADVVFYSKSWALVGQYRQTSILHVLILWQCRVMVIVHLNLASRAKFLRPKKRKCRIILLLEVRVMLIRLLAHCSAVPGVTKVQPRSIHVACTLNRVKLGYQRSIQSLSLQNLTSPQQS